MSMCLLCVFLCIFLYIESPAAEMSPAVVNAGEEVLLRCRVKFGSARNTSTSMTTQQFPRLTMTFNNVELSSEQNHTDGQPSQRPHTLTRVSTVHNLTLSTHRRTAVTAPSHTHKG